MPAQPDRAPRRLQPSSTNSNNATEARFMADLKVGVIGTGFIGPVHVEALRRLGIEVAAVAGPRADGVAEKAKTMRIAKYYDTAEALIADPEINVVHITSPNHVHHAQAKAALQA